MCCPAHTQTCQIFCPCVKQSKWTCTEDIALTGCMLPSCKLQMLYCPYHIRVIVQVLWLHMWLSMQICRFYTCPWSLSSRYLPAIYIFYIYEGCLWNALVCNTWKCHGKNQNPITDFALNLGKGQNYTQQMKEPCETLCVLFVCLFVSGDYEITVFWWIFLLFFPVTMSCFLPTACQTCFVSVARVGYVTSLMTTG